MSEPDWASGEIGHRLVVEMVDPIDHASVRGALQVSGGKVSWDAYSDTRASATIDVVDWSAYVPGSWLRVVHEVPAFGWSETLITGFVWDDGSPTTRSGGTSSSPSVMSAMKALQTDLMPCPMTVAEGGTASEAIAAVCGKDVPRRPYRILPGFADRRFTATRTYDVGDARLKILFDLCDACGARMDVDGDGTVTFARYVAPSGREPVASITCDAGDAVVLGSGIGRASSAAQDVNRSIVTWRDGDDVVSGFADVPETSDLAPGRRGYSVAELHQIDDMSEPHTAAHAAEMAAGFLGAGGSTVEWSISTMWLPVRAGDVVAFAPPGEASRRCVVKSLDADLSSWTMSMTLKEA